MKRALFFSLLLLGLCALLPAQAPAGPDDADLAARIAAVKDPDYPGAAEVTVLDRTDVTVEDSGLSRMRFRQVVKVLTAEGALKNMVRGFEYDPKSSDVQVVAVRVWRAGKPQDVDLAGLQDIPAPAQAIYWGNRTKTIGLPRLKAGDAVETVTDRKGFVLALLAGAEDEERFVPPMRGHFFDIVPFYADTPVAEKTYTVRIHRSKPLQYRFFNGEAESETTMDGDFLVYRWTKKDIRPPKREPGMPAYDDVAPKLLVSTTPTWNDKSAWFGKANEEAKAFAVTPEVQKKVDELLAGTTNEQRKIEVLTHWAAENIRYCGLSMGKGEGFILHSGEMTFRDRCGVCKDKAGMLITMLRAAGFESYPAMTMAGSRIETVPADQFNHCVTVVKRGDGTYQLLDPTWVPSTRELWSSLEQEQQYLMGVPETAGLMTTPRSDPALHFIHGKIDGTLSAQGELSGEIVLTADGQGDAALRRNLMRNPRPRMDAYFLGALAQLHPAMVVQSLQYQDPNDLSRPMEVRISFRCPGWAAVDGDTLRFLSPSLKQVLSDGGTAFYLNVDTSKTERKFPLVSRCTGSYRWEEAIRLPAGRKLSALPEDVRQDGPAAAYTRTVRQDEDVMRTEQTLVLKKRIYPAEDYADLKKSLDPLKAERKRVFLCRPEPAAK